MPSSHRLPRPGIVLVLGLGLLALLVVMHPRHASAQTCYDHYGQPRECTATEDFGQCLYASSDSYEQCSDGRNWYVVGACFIAKVADDLACGMRFVEDLALPPPPPDYPGR